MPQFQAILAVIFVVSFNFSVTYLFFSLSFLILSLAFCITISKHNDAAQELKLRLGSLVLDYNEMLVESLDDDHLKYYGDGIVILLDVISS